MSNLEKYQKVFLDTFNISKDELNNEFRFDDVEKWDSILHMNLIMQLEKEFDVLFDTEDILHYGSYENGKVILRRYGVNL